MTKVYACLTGNWVCLNDDPECVVGQNGQDPISWWKEGAEIYSPVTCTDDMANSMYNLEYVNVFYRGKSYRIHPTSIQIVTE